MKYLSIFTCEFTLEFLSLIYNVLFVFCFLLLLLSFYLFVHSFIDNYVSCHVFLVSSEVRRLLFRATENSAQGDKQARGKSTKQKAKSIVDLIPLQLWN